MRSCGIQFSSIFSIGELDCMPHQARTYTARENPSADSDNPPHIIECAIDPHLVVTAQSPELCRVNVPQFRVAPERTRAQKLLRLIGQEILHGKRSGCVSCFSARRCSAADSSRSARLIARPIHSAAKVPTTSQPTKITTIHHIAGSLTVDRRK